MLQAPSLLSLGACAVAAGVAAHVARRALLHRRSGTPALGFDAALARLSGSSVEDLILIVDFDRTLTDGDSAQCHDVIGATSLVPESLRAGFAPLLDFSDPAKVPYKGDAWWVRANELLLTHASRVLTPETVRRLVHEAPLFGTSTQPMQLRPGAARLLARLSELDVPVLIVSAGFADIIAAFLAARAVPLGSNVRVCSNLLVHDAASGQLTGIEPSPPITGCNKQLTFERNRDWFTTTHRRRRTLVVVGDSLGDLKCAEGVPADYAVATVGVFNERDGRASLEEYERAFAAVIVGNRGSLAPLTELVEAVCARSPPPR